MARMIRERKLVSKAIMELSSACATGTVRHDLARMASGGCYGRCYRWDAVARAMIFGNVFRWRQFLDQPLHMAWAAVAIAPVVYWGTHWWNGFLSGLLLALPRELWDQRPLSRETDAPLDLLCFGIGGALVGGLL